VKPRTKRILLIGGGAVVVLAIVVANLSKEAGGTQGVQVAEAKIGDISSTVRAPGKIQPETLIKLSANVPGEVKRLAVKEGDRVRKGQFLLQIDDTQYQADVRQSQAGLDAARSNLRLAEAAFAQSDAVAKRKESLFTQNLVSPEELEAARTQRNSDKARIDASREEITRGEAALLAAQDRLRKTRFDSPIDGTVTQLNIERGEIVVIGTMNNPGTVILSVADLARMKVEADVDETDVASVSLDQPATVKVDALPDTTLPGHVVEIANSPKVSQLGTQEQQTNFEVDVMLDHPPPSLRPGMTADVEVKTGTKNGVLYVPIQAVVVRTAEELEKAAKRGRDRHASSGAGRAAKAAKTSAAPAESIEKKKAEEIKGVFVLDKGVAQYRRVKTGIASDTDIEISGELKAGEKVVTGPHKVLRNLKPGAKLKVEEPKTKRQEKS
jgi:HlyD family secretion protein